MGDGELGEALKVEAVRLGLGSRVHFHGDLTEEQVAAQLDRSSVFVLPCLRTSNGRMDGIPVAIMEAQACGLVVVSTRLSGIPELAEDGVTGFLAEPGDPRSLARAFERALSPEAANLEAPYLCTRGLSSPVLGLMVGVLDGWVVSGRGWGECCGARGRPALSRSTIRGASGSAT